MDNLSFVTQTSMASRQMSNFSSNTNLSSSFQSTSNQKISDPIQYVNDLAAKPSVTLEALQHARRTIQNNADETNTQLKKNVYKNYQLFIDTSKEIAFLKKENSHMSKMLTEQTQLLDQIMSISIGGSKTGLTQSEKKEALEKIKEERERKMLASISKSALNGPLPTLEFRSLIDNIDGGSGILENKLNSLVYHEGELLELDDGNDYKEIGPVYLILLNDSLIITTPLNKFHQTSAGNRKYKFHSIIDLESIAVVNVKDRSFRKYESAFKILMSATTKVFLTGSPAKKKSWTDSFDIAKKYRRTSRMPRRDTAMSIKADTFDTVMSPTADTFTKVSMNPFEEPETENAQDSASELPYWLAELPDDLDVYIAQRNFDEAVKLVNKAQEAFLYPNTNRCDNQMQIELKLKIDNKIGELVEALSSELNVPPDRSIQTGPRASRHAVLLLLRLGKSLVAIQLFLDQRTRILKYLLKQTRSNVDQGGTLGFMKKITNTFFNNISDTCREFLKAFEINSSFLGIGVLDVGNPFETEQNSNSDPLDDQPSSGSNSNSPTVSFSHSALASLNLWAYQQFQIYLSYFPRHVFNAQTPLNMIVDSLACAHEGCIKLRENIGLDLSFIFHKQMNKNIERLIKEMREKFIESVKLRFTEPASHQQSQVFDSKDKILSLKDEMTKMGFSVEEYMRSAEDRRSDPPKPLWAFTLTSATTSFTKAFLNYVYDLLKITIDPVLFRHATESIVEGFREQMKYLLQSSKTYQKPARQLVPDPDDFIAQNIAFHLDFLVPLVIRKYCDGLQVQQFTEMQTMCKSYSSFSNDSPIQVKTDIEIYNDDSSFSYTSPIPAPRARRTQIHIRSSASPSRESSASPSNRSSKYTAGTYL